MVQKESWNFARANSAYHIYCTDIPWGRGLVQLSCLWAWSEIMSQYPYIPITILKGTANSNGKHTSLHILYIHIRIHTLTCRFRVSYRILSWGGKQDGSRMIVVYETYACLLGGSGSMLPQENFEFIYLSDCFWCNLGQNFRTFWWHILTFSNM